jgi:hypothetical protein
MMYWTLHIEQIALFFWLGFMAVFFMGVNIETSKIWTELNEFSTREEGQVADKHYIKASDLHLLDVTELAKSKVLISVRMFGIYKWQIWPLPCTDSFLAPSLYHISAKCLFVLESIALSLRTTWWCRHWEIPHWRWVYMYLTMPIITRCYISKQH